MRSTHPTNSLARADRCANGGENVAGKFLVELDPCDEASSYMGDARVLVVDDDPLVLKLVRLVFKRSGYELRTIASASDLGDDDAAWAQLAIVDMHLDQASGVEVIRRLRAANASIRILGWSADDDANCTTWKGGCDRFVTKPFDVNELRRTVDEMLRL